MKERDMKNYIIEFKDLSTPLQLFVILGWGVIGLYMAFFVFGAIMGLFLG
jgi:hypothetical protein